MLNLIFPYLKKQGTSLFIYLTCNFVNIITAILIPVQISDVLNSKANYSMIVVVIALSIICIITKIIADVRLNKSVNLISNDFLIDTMIQMQKAPLEKLNNVNKTYTVSIINNCSFILPSFILNETVETFFNFLGVIVMLIILFKINYLLCMTLMITILFQIVIYKQLRTKLLSVNTKTYSAEGTYKENVNRLFQNWKVIKAQGLDSKIKTKLLVESEKYQTIYKKKNFLQTLFDSESIIYSNATFLIIIGLTSYFVMQNTMNLGEYEIFYTYSILLISYIDNIFNYGQSYNFTKSQYNLYQDVILKQELLGKECINKISNIKFENLSFKYDDNLVLNNFNYSLTSSKIYLIKGNNGSGKSTLLSLMCGLYHATQGNIYINDQNINTLNLDELRLKNISVFDQKTKLFHESIKYNICLGDEDLYRNEYEEIKHILDIPSDDTEIDCQASNLSGGQEHKIGLLRTLFKFVTQKNDILILDEPTNHLDIQSKRKLVDFLQGISKNKIIVIISHDPIFDDICNEKILLT